MGEIRSHPIWYENSTLCAKWFVIQTNATAAHKNKCRRSIYRTTGKRRGTLRVVLKLERSSPTVRYGQVWNQIPCALNFHSLRPSDAYICVSCLTIIGSDNGLSPGRPQGIIGTNAGIMLRPIGTNFNEILIDIRTFSFKKLHFKMSSGKWGSILSRPQCIKSMWYEILRRVRVDTL